MFHVGRFDPAEEDRKEKAKKQVKSNEERRKSGKKRKKSRKDDDSGNQTQVGKVSSSLHVIAPEEVDASASGFRKNKHIRKSAEEAFDDLDIVNAIDDQAAAEEESGSNQDDDASHEEIRAALHLSKLPIRKAAEGLKVAPFLIDHLERDFGNFYPIQALAIPDVIRSERHAHIRAQDVCITAPTGSGKTLSYVLPIINSLADRQIQRLRALVVLPSRDLASQVYSVFKKYTEGSNLRVGLTIGQTDFTAEQIELTVNPTLDGANVAGQKLAFDPGNLDLALEAFQNSSNNQSPGSLQQPRDGRTAVDILVGTPGRLVDHLDNTAGFSLQHLRFLVVDEADRLLSQSYHNWIGRVIDSANSASVAMWHEIHKNKGKLPKLQLSPSAPYNNCAVAVEPITWRRGGTGGDDSKFNTNDVYFASSVCNPVQLRKFLVSATLTRDPQKLAALRLVNPKHFDVHQLWKARSDKDRHKYSMPEGLEEFTVTCTAEQKPIVLLAVLLEQLRVEQPQGRNTNDDEKEEEEKVIVAVFTASLDSTHRLFRLLQLLWAAAGYGDPNSIVEFSSALNQKERSRLVERCNDSHDNVSVVVCSDSMSRGMDIEFVSAVVNYDVPAFAKTYVHRCGRTARAGKRGAAISLLKGGQVRQFTRMRQLIHDPDKLQSMGVKKSLVRDAIPKYRLCVRALREVLDAEESGELSRTEIPSEDFMSTED